MITLPKLNFKFDGLEPFIDKQTVELHYSKHHQTYADKLNEALKETGWEDRPLEEIVKNWNQFPEDKKTAIRNNGGGVWNHNLYWQTLGRSPLKGELRTALERTWGSIDKFKEDLTKLAMNRFGSGWVWLGKNHDGLCIYSTANQDNCLMPGVECLCPHHNQCQVGGVKLILALDLWEHAYYLKYQNRRAEYIEGWWQAVNWEKVGELYLDK